MFFIFYALANTAVSDVPPIETPLCDPEKYVSKIVEDMQYSEHDFDEQSFQWAMDWLKRADWKKRVEGKTYDQPFELGWEFEMSYFNRLTAIEGYTLKLRTKNSNKDMRQKALDDFCTFVATAVRLD